MEASTQHVVMSGFVKGNHPLGEGGSIRKRWVPTWEMGFPWELLLVGWNQTK